MAATINDAARAWAKGTYPAMAGVELLIFARKVGHYPWVHVTRTNRITGHPEAAAIDVDELLAASGAWSGQEQRIVRIAASLLDGPAINLSDEISGLDTDVLDTVLACLALAGGVPTLHPAAG
ncbi:MAG TPA: hypothetical protein VGK17_10480 [Propionicimonas sp.]|jgi:hypothetical protein